MASSGVTTSCTIVEAGVIAGAELEGTVGGFKVDWFLII